jgi:hypothetical protein
MKDEFGIDMTLPFVHCCAVCRRFKIGNQWLDVYYFPEVVNVSHGYCDECAEAVLNEVKAMGTSETLYIN